MGDGGRLVVNALVMGVGGVLEGRSIGMVKLRKDGIGDIY
jgi:hypothetical protein